MGGWTTVPYHHEVLRSADDALVQSGTVFADTLPLITVPAVKVYRAGSSLRLTPLDPTAVDREGESQLLVALAGHPVTRPQTLSVFWPNVGEARLELLDVAGRMVRSLFVGHVARGRERYAFDPAPLPSGVYFVIARQGTQSFSRRLVVIH